MRAKTVLILLALFAVVGFAAGFWPQYQQRTELAAKLAALERELETTRADLNGARATVRFAELLGQGLALRDLVTAQNFGLAQQQATPFFDAVRDAAASAVPGSPQAAALDAVQALRDQLVANLSTGDARAAAITREIEERLRGGLGYAVPPMPAAGPPAATAPVAPPQP